MSIPFNLHKCIDVLKSTPKILSVRLHDFDKEWSKLNEGGDTWSAYDIVGHLIYGEKTDWIARINIILKHGKNVTFPPFNREGMKAEDPQLKLNNLLDNFAELRRENLQKLLAFNLTEEDLKKEGRHPSLGVVTLQQLLATWAVHDLNHLSQVNRVLAFQWMDETGPWVQYLGILKQSASV